MSTRAIEGSGLYYRTVTCSGVIDGTPCPETCTLGPVADVSDSYRPDGWGWIPPGADFFSGLWPGVPVASGLRCPACVNRRRDAWIAECKRMSDVNHKAWSDLRVVTKPKQEPVPPSVSVDRFPPPWFFLLGGVLVFAAWVIGLNRVLGGAR